MFEKNTTTKPAIIIVVIPIICVEYLFTIEHIFKDKLWFQNTKNLYSTNKFSNTFLLSEINVDNC